MSQAVSKNQIRSGFVFAKDLRPTIIEALGSVENARQKCLIAGQRLNEEKKRLEHGDFLAELAREIPEITVRTAQSWMRAAGNIYKALPEPVIDVESTVTVSDMLTLPDSELTAAQKKYKQSWFEFTADKTIKECCAGVFVDGDEAHRVDRAVNGKTKGGVGKQKDRKAFEKFTATKLDHITTFLCINKKSRVTGKKKVTGWRKLSPVQQTQISAAFNLFCETAPEWLLANLKDKITTELKMSDAQRITR